MRNYGKWIVSLAAGALLAVSVHAAEMVPEVETVELLMLRQHSVQKELKVGKPEATSIKEFTNSQHKKAAQVSKLGEAEQGKKYDEMAKENEEFLNKTLTAEQLKRLKQIAMQRAGLLWVTHPDIAKKLNLDAKQLEQAKSDQLKARGETDVALAAIIPGERDKKLSELKETCHKRLLKLLTEEQQKKWQEMLGSPFEGEFTFDESEKK